MVTPEAGGKAGCVAIAAFVGPVYLAVVGVPAPDRPDITKITDRHSPTNPTRGPFGTTPSRSGRGEPSSPRLRSLSRLTNLLPRCGWAIEAADLGLLPGLEVLVHLEEVSDLPMGWRCGSGSGATSSPRACRSLISTWSHGRPADLLAAVANEYDARQLLLRGRSQYPGANE